ncbi:MAG: exodeoxyribonuclease VII small subunit [Myxococcota bacterium]
MAKSDKGDIEEPFELLMGKLETVVSQLEAGELSLEKSLEAYEAGVGLVRRAQSRLDQMDRRLEELKADGSVAPLTLEGSEGTTG